RLTPTLVLALLAFRLPTAHSITVPAGSNLQDALNRARPGDTLLLDRDATYVGNFVLPVRGRPGDPPITLRTTGDSAVPAGERMTPAAATHLAKLRSPNSSPAMSTAAGTSGWRIELVEFQANRDGVGDIIALGNGSGAQRSLADVPSGLELDRVYIHGD